MQQNIKIADYCWILDRYYRLNGAVKNKTAQ